MNNKDIKDSIKNAGLYQWMVADRINMAESTFYRKMRHELPEEEKQKIYSAIEELKKQKEAV